MALQIALPQALDGMDVGQFCPCLVLFELTYTCLQYSLNKPLSDVFKKKTFKKKTFKKTLLPPESSQCSPDSGVEAPNMTCDFNCSILSRKSILAVMDKILENCISYYACFCSPIFSLNICESYFKKTLYFQNEKFQISSKSIWMVSFVNIHTFVYKTFIMNLWIFIIFLPGFCLLLGSRCQMPFLVVYQSI